MKKLLILLLVFLLLLPGCGKEAHLEKAPQEPLPEITDRDKGPAYGPEKLAPAREDSVNNLPGVTMQLIAQNQSYLTVRISSSGNMSKGICTSEDYWLDYYDGAWYSVPLLEGLDWGAADVAYEIYPQQSRDFEICHTQLYGTLPAGQYRIVKSAEYRNEMFYLAAEFTVSHPSFD